MFINQKTKKYQDIPATDTKKQLMEFIKAWNDTGKDRPSTAWKRETVMIRRFLKSMGEV